MSASTCRRALLGALAAAGLAVGLATWRAAPREPPLAPTIAVEDVVTHFSRRLDPAAVVEQDARDPVRAGELRPGDPLMGHGERPGLITPPRSRLRFRVAVPPGGALRFGVGVEGDGQRDTARSALRFAVAVDGQPVWSRTVNPAATRRDRRWFDERVELAAFTGRTIDLELITEAERPGRPLAGRPGWGGVQLVQATPRPRQRAGADRPNVLVLLVDTLRADALGLSGATPSPSPHLDRFAATGLVFEQSVAQAPWTLPSVATLFTGLHPRSHGAIGDTVDTRTHAVWGFLSDAVDTLAERATAAGITTIGVSTNPIVSRGTNLAQGFERFVELPWSNEERNWAPATEVHRVFVDWLEHHRDWRFLAYLHYMEPHDPYTPPAALRPPAPPGMRKDLAAGWVLDVSRRMLARGDIVLPPEQIAYLRALYDGEIRVWDAELAHLLDALDRLGVRDSTVVVITADHGEEFMEHGQLRHRKHLYDESIRVPLVVVGPGVPAGRRLEQAQGIDLLPTLAALLGLDVPARLPGRNLLAALPARSETALPARTLPGALPARTAISETMGGLSRDGRRADLVAARTPEWKLIEAPALPAVELYDLANDPIEQTPLPSHDGTGIVLRGELDEFARTAAPPPARDGSYDPALREKLRVLGYTD